MSKPEASYTRICDPLERVARSKQMARTAYDNQSTKRRIEGSKEVVKPEGKHSVVSSQQILKTASNARCDRTAVVTRLFPFAKSQELRAKSQFLKRLGARCGRELFRPQANG
jgi:hypothetical protein